MSWRPNDHLMDEDSVRHVRECGISHLQFRQDTVERGRSLVGLNVIFSQGKWGLTGTCARGGGGGGEKAAFPAQQHRSLLCSGQKVASDWWHTAMEMMGISHPA